ncbi:MAG: 3-hydroxyacyl-CoA dehydrogenase family protein, partial [Paracoccaceae bacterium]
VGTDLTLDIHNTVLADLENRPGPSPLLQQMVADGRFGMKSGQGFHTWTASEAKTVREKVVRHLLRLETILED